MKRRRASSVRFEWTLVVAAALWSDEALSDDREWNCLTLLPPGALVKECIDSTTAQIETDGDDRFPAAKVAPGVQAIRIRRDASGGTLDIDVMLRTDGRLTINQNAPR